MDISLKCHTQNYASTPIIIPNGRRCYNSLSLSLSISFLPLALSLYLTHCHLYEDTLTYNEHITYNEIYKWTLNGSQN